MATPKFGTLVPNRVFVGGISASTSEAELTQLFSAYGNVKATKIISDRAGVSKGYGFVTFETDEEAQRLQQEPECIILRERKLNIAPAIKKQPFSRLFDGGSGSPPALPTSTYYYGNGMGLTYQSGLTFYNTGAAAPGPPIAAPTDSTTIYQTAGIFGPQATAGHQTFAPVVYTCPTPSLYMPQQYQYSPVTYEPYYTGAVAGSGLPQYALYATSASANSHEQQSQQGQSNGRIGGNGVGSNASGAGGNGPSVSSPLTLTSLPPPANHFYPTSAPPPPPHCHHHPPVASCSMPPQPQLDQVYYSFTAPGPSPIPPQPQHQTPGIGDQQLLLYMTDPTSCRQLAVTSESQAMAQEVQFYATGLQAQSHYHQQQMIHHHQQQLVGQRRFPGTGQSVTPGRKLTLSCSQAGQGSGEHFRRAKNKVNDVTHGGVACKIQDDRCLGGGGDASGSNMASMLSINSPSTPRTCGASAHTVVSGNNTGNNGTNPIKDACHQMQTLAL